ncbi:MAG: hypothetical protein KGQ70_06935, partial [Alphaproteobacteria bacterium]|nr:hypothetical protein [Alphaproteobacteria bacterium]
MDSDEADRTEMVVKEGSCFTTGAVIKSGNKHKGKEIVSTGHTVPGGTQASCAIEKIIKVIDKKFKKGNSYPKNTALLVFFKDKGFYLTGYKADLIQQLTEKYSGVKTEFSHLFLLGSENKIFLETPLKGAQFKLEVAWVTTPVSHEALHL